MRSVIAAMVILVCGWQAAQAAESCMARANAKHLAGAARTSFLAKCEKTDKPATANEHCRAQAHEKKLHGAAESSFVKKCEKDAAASK